MNAIRLVVFLFVFSILTACSSTAMFSHTLTSQQAIDAITNAGLPIKDVEVSKGGALAQSDVVDVAVFRIPTEQGEATANIFTFASDEQAAQYDKNSQTSAFSTPDMTLMVFSHRNLHVMIFGQVPGNVVQKYATVIRSMN